MTLNISSGQHSLGGFFHVDVVNPNTRPAHNFHACSSLNDSRSNLFITYIETVSSIFNKCRMLHHLRSTANYKRIVIANYLYQFRFRHRLDKIDFMAPLSEDIDAALNNRNKLTLISKDARILIREEYCYGERQIYYMKDMWVFILFYQIILQLIQCIKCGNSV